jgi:hypothetical protein
MMVVHFNVKYRHVIKIVHAMDGHYHGLIQITFALLYVETHSLEGCNNVMIRIQIHMMDVHLYVKYKHAEKIVLVMVGYYLGIVQIINVM